MFGGLVLAMLIGFPVASRWQRSTVVRLPVDPSRLLRLQFPAGDPRRIFGSVLSNELLLAIPFFTFMGAVLERCGLAETC